MRIALSLALLAACGDDDPPHDGGTDARDDAAPSFVVAPMPPEPPRIAPCPTGWRETVDDVTLCEPPDGDGSDCDAGTARFVGGDTCVAIGVTCPADGWPTGDATLYVRTGGSGGDGTRAAPLGTIGEAIARASRGTTIAIAAGTYDEPVAVPAGVTLIGACAAQTILRSSVPDTTMRRAVVTLADGASLGDLQIADSARVGVVVNGRASLRSVEIAAVTYAAIVVPPESVLDADRLAVRDVAAPRDGTGQAIVMIRAEVHLARSVLQRAAATAVLLSGGTFTAASSRFSDVMPPSDCLAAEDGQIELDQCVVERCGDAALQGNGETTIAIARSVLRESAGGIELLDGAGATVTTTLLERNRRFGIDLRGGMLHVEDVVIRDTISTEAFDGLGIATLGGQIELARTALLRSSGNGLYLDGEGSSVRATDLRVHDTSETPTPSAAIQIQHAAHAEIERATVLRNAIAGINVIGDATASLRDVRVEDSRASTTLGIYGYGVVSALDSTIDLERAVIARNQDIGSGGSGGSTLTMRDVTLEETRPRACAETDCADQPGGYALIAIEGATVRAERFLLNGAPLCGSFVEGEAALDLRTGIVSRAAIGACVQSDGYDLARLTDDVRYVENTLNLDTTVLPVPDLGLGVIGE